MNIELTPENLLIQLGYPVKEATLAQMQRIIDNTPGFEKFAKHILTLNDEVKRFAGVVAMSNSKDYLKVKTDSTNPEEIEAFNEYVKQWAEKYKVALQKVEGKNTYYILGHK
ncbi:hypothetical protein [Nitratifractor salsuginis]|uniref:Uncharacterized protein n=1 Tax=Nitratifractor salsuginis (strain DSM 16511 / JCM 12458 / E9I37-1) TaxID=749222 RepID=E6WXT5_NITSE|nr:hypothetical protein [Nitratifractor salsuginis]ADV46342.1 hypothetical protein Nitsa_1086 [Nitratifractor salsuginis DSM 16511]